MPKPKGLFSIGEIAVTCGVSINALRFYETKDLVKPAYTDPESGYRYYSRENLLRLRAVLSLKDAGLSLPEVKEYLDGNKCFDARIAKMEKRCELLNRAIEALKIRRTKPGDLTVEEFVLPERLCLCRTVTAKNGEEALFAIGEFFDELIRRGVRISRGWPDFCEYPDKGLLQGDFRITDFTVTACMPVEETQAPPEAVRYPAGDAVAVSFRGSIYDVWKAYDALRRYIEAHKYTPAGYPQEIYLEAGDDGPMDLKADHNITRVIVPIKK